MSDFSVNNTNPYSEGNTDRYKDLHSNSSNSKDQSSKIDPEKHPIAAWEVDKWGWSNSDALKGEKAFDKTFEKQCMAILNKYKHEMKPLNPNSTDN